MRALSSKSWNLYMELLNAIRRHNDQSTELPNTGFDTSDSPRPRAANTIFSRAGWWRVTDYWGAVANKELCPGGVVVIEHPPIGPRSFLEWLAGHTKFGDTLFPRVEGGNNDPRAQVDMNAFGAVPGLQSGRPDERAVLTQAVTCLNHSNAPNCCYQDYWFAGPYVSILIKVVVAIRPILPGEELTISYGRGWHDEPFTLGAHSDDTALIAECLARAAPSAERLIHDYLHSGEFLAMLDRQLQLFEMYATELARKQFDKECKDLCAGLFSGIYAAALCRVRSYWANPRLLVCAQKNTPCDKISTDGPPPAYATVDADFSFTDLCTDSCTDLCRNDDR